MGQYKIKDFFKTKFNPKDLERILKGREGWQIIIKADDIIIQTIKKNEKDIKFYFSIMHAKISKALDGDYHVINFPKK